MILLGDVGGTNCRFALVKKRGRKFFYFKIYKSKNFKNLFEIIENYLKESLHLQKEKVELAILAVAGPVFDKEAFLTNLNWKVSSQELEKSFNLKKVLLLNDLEALAGCLNFLKKEELIPLYGLPVKAFPKAFLSLGTGLGEAVLVKEKPLTLLPTEAGHTFFSPLEEEEWNYLNFLKKKGEELSWESTLSGKGLSLLYEFFYKENKSSEEITSLAKEGKPFAKKVILKFIELIGRKVSQTALTSLPLGGIYLAGGVILGLKQFLMDKENYSFFQKGYLENFKMRFLLQKIPVYIINHPFPGLLGALSILRNQQK